MATCSIMEEVPWHSYPKQLYLRGIWNSTINERFPYLLSDQNWCGSQDNWRGVWNKALSDFWCNVKFSLSFTTWYKEIWKKNLVIYQKSLKAFLQAPLQLVYCPIYYEEMASD